jgi:hypothetical protein
MRLSWAWTHQFGSKYKFVIVKLIRGTRRSAEYNLRTGAIRHVSKADAVNTKLSSWDLELWRHWMEIWTEFFTSFTHICRVLTALWDAI